MEMKGKLFAIEGVDGSGKHTQAVSLMERLGTNNTAIVSFPRHTRDSSLMADKYLAGQWSDKRKELNHFTVSSFYSIDRAISYATENWGKVYDEGGIVIADRYTQSNIIHQYTKASIKAEESGDSFSNAYREDYVKWLYHLEYDRFAIPMPDMVFFLKISKQANERIIKDRIKSDPDHADIHELNLKYMESCRKTIEMIQCSDDWWMESTVYPIKYVFIETCDSNGFIRPANEITDEILYHITMGN